MAYLKQCIPIARSVGVQMSAARRTRDAAYASAAFYDRLLLKTKARTLRQQADVRFERERERLISIMERNGCL